MIHRAITQALTPLAAKRQVRAVFSSPSVDRMGDMIVQGGIDLSSYKSNPVILWAHDPTKPIAKAATIGVTDGSLSGLIQFPALGTSSLSDEIFGLIAAGVINACSIGFQPVESVPLNPQKPYAGTKFTKTALMEISFVSVPANTDALVTERGGRAPGRATGMAVSGLVPPETARARRAREVEVMLLSVPPLGARERREIEVARLARSAPTSRAEREAEWRRLAEKVQ